jgi:hypothetical protein
VSGSEGWLPRRKPGFEKPQVGLIRQRFADLVWLAGRSLGTAHAGDIMAVNLKTPDFSPLSKFLVGTSGESLEKRACARDLRSRMDPENVSGGANRKNPPKPISARFA